MFWKMTQEKREEPSRGEFSSNAKIETIMRVIESVSLNSSEFELLASSCARKAIDMNLKSLQEPQHGKDNERINIAKLSSDSVKTVVQLKAVGELTNNTKCLLSFLQDFSGKVEVLPNLTGMSIRMSKKRKVIQLRENSKGEYFTLISYPISHMFTTEDIDTLKKAQKRFRSRVDAKMFWKDITFLLSGTFREIKTFHQLFELYKEGQTIGQIRKIERYQKRYLSLGYGDKLLVNYCAESFRKDFLDRKPHGHQLSDRNELIKIVSAAISKAKGMMNVKIDVQPLIRKGERSRTDKSDNKPPMLSTVSALILKAYELEKDELGLELIIQYMASTRVACTDALEWRQVKWEKPCIEVPSEKSKTGYRNHPIPRRLLDILRAEQNKQSQCSKLTNSKNGEPMHLFESDRNKGRSVSNMDDNFNFVKGQLLADAINSSFTAEQFEDIKSFTRHTIRDLVEDELMGLHASEAQKEKCLGRKPNELGQAYGNLDLKALSKLKDRMVEKAEKEFPELKALFEQLIDNYRGVMLESGGVKKGVKNLP